MNSCQKVAWSIRNTTLIEVMSSRVKQFVRDAQNCGKINHGFCTTHPCLYLYYSPDLLPDFLFTKLKTPMKGKLFATIKEIKEKSKQELLAISKSTFQKCFEDWKKRCHMRIIISEQGYFEGDKIVIEYTLKYFLEF